MSQRVQLIEPARFEDERGWFSEVYSEAHYAALGIDCRFVQDNQSLSRSQFTLRGLHYQASPHGQAKLVRCLYGRVFDVVVDIRAGSPTFGHWTGAELSAENGHVIYVPVGFAHGFLTLEADCEITYKVSSPWSGAAERSIRWDDPAIGIRWPMPEGTNPLVSAKDAGAMALADCEADFVYTGDPLVALGA